LRPSNSQVPKPNQKKVVIGKRRYTAQQQVMGITPPPPYSF
jgi:hypothetical protein